MAPTSSPPGGTPRRLSPGTRLGGAGLRTTWTFTKLPPVAAYFWSVQAVESAYAGGAFAPLQGILNATFTGVMAPVPGQATVTFTGASGRSCWIEYSDDLVVWHPGGTATENPADGGNFMFQDAHASRAMQWINVRASRVLRPPAGGGPTVRVAGSTRPHWSAGLVWLFALWMVSAVAPHGRAAEVMPPAPPRHFNDYAQVVSPQAADRLNRKLEEFEKTTSNQFVVAAFAKMESPSSIEDYVRRVFQEWKIGQKEKNNGVLLAVFVQDRKLRIEVGSGLNGVLPDALARRIIDREITPHFKRGDYEAGLAAGINAILAATRGESRGTGRTKAQEPSGLGWVLQSIIFNSYFPWHLVIASALFVAIRQLVFGRGETVYDSRGRHDDGGWGWNSDSGGWSSGGGGDGSSSGGGGFSGGGGSSGGGGASGSW